MTNPLFETHTLPPFAEIKAEHVKPAIESLLNENRAKVSQLTEQGDFSWKGLAQQMDNLSDRLHRAWSPVSHLNSVVNNDELREAYNACVTELSKYSTEIGQNGKLFEGYKAIEQGDEFSELSQAQQKAVKNTLRDFRLAGVDLPEEKKQRYKVCSERLAELGSKYSDNVLDATQAWTKHFENADQLKGLPETALAGAAQAAKNRDKEGYLLTLEFPSYYAVMTHCDNRELRQEVYEAYSTRASDQGPFAGKWDNSDIMRETLELRSEVAQLLGFAKYTDYSLATKMGKSPQEVLTFLNELAEKSLPVAKRDYRELVEHASEHYGLRELKAWDISYFGEKLRQHKYTLSEEELRPYFPVEKVIEGMFEIVGRLFGITLHQQKDVSTYHPDVRFFEVRRDGELLAYLYMDEFARENKRGGAWMDDYTVRRRLDDGNLVIPVAYITCNFTPPTEDRPALLTHNEVTTLFHEFGHSLHHMLTKVECYDVSGINGVPWDAVELPSQFMENWCWQEEAIGLISSHYKTGESLPKDLLDKMLAAKNFMSGMQMMRQLEFALFDFRLHNEFEPGTDFSIQQLLDDVRSKVAVVEQPAFNRFQHNFSHIFAGGYAAGYYSYKWAEVLSADAFSKFEEIGVFDESTGREFMRNILEMGGSQEPMDLFIAFRGRAPQVDALLRHSGIVA